LDGNDNRVYRRVNATTEQSKVAKGQGRFKIKVGFEIKGAAAS